MIKKKQKENIHTHSERKFGKENQLLYKVNLLEAIETHFLSCICRNDVYTYVSHIKNMLNNQQK